MFWLSDCSFSVPVQISISSALIPAVIFSRSSALLKRVTLVPVSPQHGQIPRTVLVGFTTPVGAQNKPDDGDQIMCVKEDLNIIRTKPE